MSKGSSKRFLFAWFIGTFLSATVLMTGALIFISSGNAAEAMEKYHSFMKEIKNQPKVMPSENVIQVMESINHLQQEALDVDERFERAIDSYFTEKNTREGLSYVVKYNEESLKKIYDKGAAIEMPAGCLVEDEDLLQAAKTLFLKRVKNDMNRQMHYQKIVQDVSSGKVSNYHELYIEDTVHFMEKIKVLEDKYQLQYQEARYVHLKNGKKPQRQELQWVKLIHLGKIDQRQGRYEEAEKMYRRAIALQNDDAKAAGFVHLALLEKQQGHYEKYSTYLEEAEIYWPGVKNGTGEFKACRKQGLISSR